MSNHQISTSESNKCHLFENKKTGDYLKIFYFPSPPINKHKNEITISIKPITQGYIKKSSKVVADPKINKANPITNNPFMMVNAIFSPIKNCKFSFNVFGGTICL